MQLFINVTPKVIFLNDYNSDKHYFLDIALKSILDCNKAVSMEVFPEVSHEKHFDFVDCENENLNDVVQGYIEMLDEDRRTKHNSRLGYSVEYTNNSFSIVKYVIHSHDVSDKLIELLGG